MAFESPGLAQQVMSPNRAEARAAGDDRQQAPNGVERSGQNPFSPQDAGLRFDVADPVASSDGYGRQSLLETARGTQSVQQQSFLETARGIQSGQQQSLLEAARWNTVRAAAIIA